MSRVVSPGLAAKLEAERRLKEGISGHRTGLPKKLLELFAPLDPPEKLTDLKKPKLKQPYTGIGHLVGEFVEPDDPQYEPARPADIPTSPRIFANPEFKTQARIETETLWEKRQRISKEKVDKGKNQIEDTMKDWDPTKDPNSTGDPFKTLFVSRISYEATERKLRREFEEFGQIKNIRLVHEKNGGKSRGYAFIEFEHKNDMKLAYKMADGKKIEGKRVSVDVERGRTVPNWRPRRLGGGKGGESREKKVSKKKPFVTALLAAAAPPAPSAPEKAAEDKEVEREKEKDKEKERAKEKEREHEKERDRDAERHRDRERDSHRDRDRERERDRDRERPRAKDEDFSKVPPPGSSSKRATDRDRDREANGERHDKENDRRERDRDRERDRKRDRSDRETGERDRHDDGHRSSKRHRDERSSRRRERDLV